MPEWRQHKRDWTAVDAAILRVLRSASEPLAHAQIIAKAKVPRLHFDMRLQSLKHRGFIEVADGRTITARWRARQPLTSSDASGSIAVMATTDNKTQGKRTPLEGLRLARSTVAGIIGRPATHAEVDECLLTFDEIIRAVQVLPNLPAQEQREAARLLSASLSEIRSVVQRRPR